jgi:hypothetical protein
MATRAERFKATVERSGPKKKADPPRKAKRQQASKTESSRGKADPERRIEASEHTEDRNVSKRASKKAVTALEDSTTGKPSRKSTRSSKNRGLPSDNLQRRAKQKTTTPEARAAKAKAKAKKTR